MIVLQVQNDMRNKCHFWVNQSLMQYCYVLSCFKFSPPNLQQNIAENVRKDCRYILSEIACYRKQRTQKEKNLLHQLKYWDGLHTLQTVISLCFTGLPATSCMSQCSHSSLYKCMQFGNRAKGQWRPSWAQPSSAPSGPSESQYFTNIF